MAPTSCMVTGVMASNLAFCTGMAATSALAMGPVGRSDGVTCIASLLTNMGGVSSFTWYTSISLDGGAAFSTLRFTWWSPVFRGDCQPAYPLQPMPDGQAPTEL